MKLHAHLILLVLLSFSCCATSKEYQPTDLGQSEIKVASKPSDVESSSFSGKVRNFETAEMMSFVNVFLLDEEGNRRGVITDMDGYFNLKNIPLGIHRLMIEMPGYEKVDKMFKIEEHTNFQLEVKLLMRRVQVEKPVIYLYPTEKQEVHVKLDYKGELSHTYPKYKDGGWTVTAEPNGTLWDEKGQEYYALFWEGIPKEDIIPQDGFVISGEETAAFLEEKLAFLGLNRREANEFIMFWLPRMENNAYNLIHFASEAYEKQAELIVTPQPETSIRVMMLTQPLKNNIQFPLQDLSSLKKERKGFTLVEWGGAVISSVKESL
jgi:CarboxypepD_reg-like domain